MKGASKLPLSKTSKEATEIPSGDSFRSEWIDFEYGIRVGNLKPHERITQILKFHLESKLGTSFITDRWGRGVFWKWICWLPRANREAKPISNKVNFSSAKLFITIDQTHKVFKSGLQVERGYISGPETEKPWGLRPDFDWHRLVSQCREGTLFDKELKRLVKQEGFIASVIGEDSEGQLTYRNIVNSTQAQQAFHACSPDGWAGFQLYYPMQEQEVKACSGYEIVQSIIGTFEEVIPAMNECMLEKFQ